MPLKQLLHGYLFTGGNLYDKINQQKGELFTEEVGNNSEHYSVYGYNL